MKCIERMKMLENKNDWLVYLTRPNNNSLRIVFKINNDTIGC